MVIALIALTDGRLVSGDADNLIKIWDSKPPYSCLAILTEHTDWITSLTVLHDGKLASGSKDKLIKIWDSSPPYSCLATLSGHADCVRALTVLHDGRLVSGANTVEYNKLKSMDNSIKIWDSKPPYSCLTTLVEHSNGVNALIVLPDGRLVSGSSDKTIKIWDVGSLRYLNEAELKQLFSILQHNTSIHQLDLTSVNLIGTEEVLADLISKRPQLQLTPNVHEIPRVMAILQQREKAKVEQEHLAKEDTEARTRLEQESLAKEVQGKAAQEHIANTNSSNPEINTFNESSQDLIPNLVAIDRYEETPTNTPLSNAVLISRCWIQRPSPDHPITETIVNEPKTQCNKITEPKSP